MSRRSQSLAKDTSDRVFEIRPSRIDGDIVLRIVAGRPPVTVDQNSCERFIGIPKKKYMSVWHARRFPRWKDGKQLLALFEDVKRYWIRNQSGQASSAILARVARSSTTPEEPSIAVAANDHAPVPAETDLFLHELDYARTE
jgi:hypothetical protein